MKIPKPKRRRDVDDVTFACDVQLIVRLIEKGEVEEVLALPANVGKYTEERKLAEDFIYLNKLIQGAMQERSFGDRLALDAEALLEAIIFGRDHPVWWYFSGLQKGAVRSKRVSTARSKMSRAIVIAWTHILKEDGCRHHVKHVADILIENNVKITPDTIKAWWGRADPELEHMVAEFVQRITETAARRGLTRSSTAQLWTLGEWLPSGSITPP